MVCGDYYRDPAKTSISGPSPTRPGRGGYPVLITGYACSTVHFRNPSGHTVDVRRATLPAEVSSSFFGGRGIALAPLWRMGGT